MARIVIIEDELFAVEHLIKVVKSLNHEVVGDYYSGEEFLENADWNFDIAIIDIFLADKLTGIDIAKEMNKRQKIFIFLTANKDSKTLTKAAKLRPSAYLTKPFQVNDVTAALEIASANATVENEKSYLQFLTHNDLSSEPLTQRELDLLIYLIEDHSNAEIGDKLFVSSNTVKYHIRNIYQKIEVKSRDELRAKVLLFLLA
ncbi:MAG: DNA-binding NarL/FixJ family response regulator [Patiriisocius sp.]|jgi:DNA-binding NarL/FixJ family response regulator